MKKTIPPFFVAAFIFSSCVQAQQNNTGTNTSTKTNVHRIAGTTDGTQPEYPDGDLPAANKYINDHFVYPERLRKQIQSDGNPPTGKVWVKFTIDENSNIKDVETNPDVSYDVTDEAERVLKEMPKWVPATLAGKPVAYHMALRLMLDPNKDVQTIVTGKQDQDEPKVSPQDRIAYEQEKASKQPYAKIAVAEYQTQKAKEKAEGYVDDAALTITRKQLGARIVWREKFLKKYPLSPVSSKVNLEILSMMDVLIFSRGLDNSPTYETQGQTMLAGVKKEFEELIKLYPGSPMMQVLGKYYEMEKVNGFKCDRDRDFSFRYKYGIPAMD